MNRLPRYPSLYQINTRVWLTELSRALGRAATLDDISDDALDRLRAQGFDWIWLLSVWKTSAASRQVSRTNPDWRHEFEETLSDLSEDDIGGSGFAIAAYEVAESLGGAAALARLRQRLAQRGLRLMLDFVPNHMGLDHPWVQTHPEYFVSGREEDLARAPQNFVRVRGPQGDFILAYGRDPYFSGWPDTLQLDYSHPGAQEAMTRELLHIARQADGVRCDMAMLVLPEVFERTWGRPAQPFWPAAIQRVRAANADFTFMAEVYWNMEWSLQQQGFDYCYDKRLYDRLREGDARPVREHFWAGADYQDRLARFLENHDEPRAATAFEIERHEAAAVITFLSPGLRFFHQGQFEGRRKRISPHLIRAPEEAVDAPLARFYARLLRALRQDVVREGRWQLLDCAAAWPGNWTSDSFIAFGWRDDSDCPLLAVVNFSDHQSQCRVRVPGIPACAWQLTDLLSDDVYERDGGEMESPGLYVDMRPWQAAVYSCAPLAAPREQSTPNEELNHVEIH